MRRTNQAALHRAASPRVAHGGRLTANRDFEIFKREFLKYQKLFGLTGWKVYFKYEESDVSFASIQMDFDNSVATVRLNSHLPDKDHPFKDVRRSAKHEVIHLLLGRIEGEARARYTTQGTLGEALEEAIHRLESLIP